MYNKSTKLLLLLLFTHHKTSLVKLKQDLALCFIAFRDNVYIL